MEKQTAVEWLVDKICTEIEMYDEYGEVNGVEFWYAFRSCTDLTEYINQAKEMFEQQIKDAWENGFREFYDGSSTPEEYYNENYETK
jgi:hypothetical protein